MARRAEQLALGEFALAYLLATMPKIVRFEFLQKRIDVIDVPEQTRIRIAVGRRDSAEIAASALCLNPSPPHP